jgi:hypothetical protein
VYRDTGDAESFWGPVLAGVAAGAVASLTRVPTEVVKQRLQTREFAGAVQAVRFSAGPPLLGRAAGPRAGGRALTPHARAGRAHARGNA